MDWIDTFTKRSVEISTSPLPGFLSRGCVGQMERAVSTTGSGSLQNILKNVRATDAPNSVYRRA